jgi:hypothetical protein
MGRKKSAGGKVKPVKSAMPAKKRAVAKKPVAKKPAARRPVAVKRKVRKAVRKAK